MCNLCNGKNHTLIFKEAPTFPTSTETNAIELSIFKNVLYIDLDLYDTESIHGQVKINFCPFCGKHLTKATLNPCSFCDEHDHEIFSGEAPIFTESSETNNLYLDMINTKLVLFGDLYESESIEDTIKISYCPFCGKKLKESEQKINARK